MNQSARGEPERRRHTRISPKGTVTIHAVGNAHYARLANIGVGGMYVATDVSLPDRLLDPAGFDNWLSDATSTADLPARIRELLFGSRGR